MPAKVTQGVRKARRASPEHQKTRPFRTGLGRTSPGMECQALSALTRLARRETLRDAVFL